MNRLALLLVTVTGIASAALVTTSKPGPYSLRDSQSKPIDAAAEFNALPADARTQEACVAAATKIGAGEYRCTNATTVAVVGSCDNALPPPVVVNGFIERGTVEGHACADGPNGPEMYFTQMQPVRDPYPSCAWVDKPIKITECEGIVNPWWLPDTTVAIDGPPDIENGTEVLAIEPGPWIEGVDYPMGDACPEAAQGRCYASPNTPKDPPAGCVSEFCVTG